MFIRCPICRKEIPDAPDDFAERPFCSRRCKTIDLGNWLSESYRISRLLGPEDEFEVESGQN
ncbi:MAG: DNA gyrase inhibitor YacG [Nannocystis sp.]|nr:DNA gyrase inhibitor YacG [Nannocystis sp.]